MNRHERYLQQAGWTRNLRAYLFQKAGLSAARRGLEVGCGTGAILADLSTRAALYGLDLDPVALTECRVHARSVTLTLGDALHLPYADEAFDIVYCHFLLLWVREPLRVVSEMKRVACGGGHVLAMAEPDYSARTDKPDELAAWGRLQEESLRRQGANPSFGARLAETFHRAGIKIIETGTMQSRRVSHIGPEEREREWELLAADLAGLVPEDEIRKMKILDERAWAHGERVLNVPTYFAWGQT